MSADPARTARDPLELLALTAALHTAAREPQRWPAAWAALCGWFDCADVFGPGPASTQAAPVQVLQQASQTAAAARHCAHAGTGACAQGPQADPAKHRSCRLVADHLNLALAAGAEPADGRAADLGPAPFVQALDALPVPMIWCRVDGSVLHTNAAAGPELAQGRWLRVEQGRLHARSGALHRRLMPALAQVGRGAASAAGDAAVQTIAAPGLNIGLRRVSDVDAVPVLLLSLVAHESAQAARPIQGRDWPPRQRELAGLLLAGHSLASAAQAMGIARSTAVSHLTALFRATGTRRQQDLIRQLSRDPFG